MVDLEDRKCDALILASRNHGSGVASAAAAVKRRNRRPQQREEEE